MDDINITSKFKYDVIEEKRDYLGWKLQNKDIRGQ